MGTEKEVAAAWTQLPAARPWLSSPPVGNCIHTDAGEQGVGRSGDVGAAAWPWHGFRQSPLLMMCC